MAHVNTVQTAAAQTAADLSEGFKMTELGPLPEAWEVARLDDIARVTAGGSAPQGGEYFGGRHPFVRVQHLDDGYAVRRWDLITDEAVQKHRLRLFPRGTIAFPKSGASIRLEKRAILPIDAYLVSHLCALLPNEQVVDPYFLFFVLRFRRLSSEKAEGYPTLTLSEIKRVAVPLPSLAEQQAIARVLRTVQHANEATERVIAGLQELKKSLMRHLSTYGPVPIDQADRVPLTDTEIGPVPEHWEVVRLGEYATISTGTTPSTKRQDYYVGTIPFIKTSEIANVIIRSSLTYVSEEAVSDYHLKLYPPGTVFLAMYGQGKTRGQVALLGIHAATSQNTASIVPSERVNGEYLWCYLMSQYEALRGEGIQGHISHLNLGYVNRLQIPLPPAHEQTEIARIMQTVERKIDAEESRKATLEALFKTLLHQLMTGRVRV